MIRARGLAVGREGQSVLEGLDFEVKPGEIVGIVGRSGAGKSTLLSSLSGELKPVAGELLVGGKAPREWSSQERARRIGFLRQSPQIFGAFSVREVVALGRSPHGDSESQSGLRICEQALELLGIPHLASRICHSLSGGEQQRVHLARVLVQVHSDKDENHGLLLLDEPTSALDLAAQSTLISLLERIRSQGVTVVLSLHDLNLAMSRCNRVLLVGGGGLLGFGEPEEVLNPQMIQSAFGIEVQMLSRPGGGRGVIVPA